MLPSELLDLFRTEVADTAKPYLWSDEFVIGAIDDAQKQFARKTEGIPDSTTAAVTQIPVLADALTGLYAADFALHPSIKKIRSARRADTGRPVEVINQEDMPSLGMYFNGVAGELKALVVGMDQDRCRVWPAPKTNVTILLSVFRLPLVDITDDQAFEIPPQHHRHLLLWVKHLAYSVQDGETLDRTKARDFEDKFDMYCASTSIEQARARHKPRTVAYGGI